MAPEGLRRGVVWVSGGIGVAMLATLVSNVLAARLLSVEDAGAYFVLVSFVALVAIFGRLGLDRGVIKHLALTERGRRSGTFSSIALLTIALAVACAVLLIALWPWVESGFNLPTTGIWIAGCLSAVWLAGELSRLVFSEAIRARGAVARATLLGNAGRASALCAVLAIIAHSRDSVSLLELVAYNSAVSMGFLLAAATCAARLLGGLSLRRIELPAALRTSIPFALSGVMAFATNGADVLIAGMLIPESEVAGYALASRTAQTLALGGTAMTFVLAPVVGRLLHQERISVLEHKTRVTTTIFGYPATFVALVFVSFGSTVMVSLYGPEYRESGRVLAILALGTVATAITGANGYLLMMSSHSSRTVSATAIVTFAQLVAMVAMARVGGAVGLALASAIGTILLNLTYSVMLRRLLALNSLPYLSRARVRP